MKIGLIGMGKMNRAIQEACSHPIVCTTRDHVVDLSADLYIDFSHGSLVEENALLLAANGKYHLIGTTGWESAQVPKAFEKSGAALFCPNFSHTVARFLQAAQLLMELLGAPKKAVEWHHKSKKDAPSGTAKRLGIPFESVRTEETLFKHSLFWDEISLTHETDNRTAYVQGALQAADWLYGKKGWFTDVDFFGSLHPTDHALCQ